MRAVLKFSRVVQDRENGLGNRDLNRSSLCFRFNLVAKDKTSRLLRQSTSHKNSVQSCGRLLKTIGTRVQVLINGLLGN
jgi:hypothetical protein